MTTEQLKELGEALSIMSAKSSVLKERDELRALMEENLQAEEVSRMRCFDPAIAHPTLIHRTPSRPLAHSRSASGPCSPRSTLNSRNTTPALAVLSR